MARIGVHTSPRSSPLLQHLLAAVPLVARKLAMLDEPGEPTEPDERDERDDFDELARWDAVRVAEPGGEHGYIRVSCRDLLGAGRRRLGVAVHLFERGDHAGSLHDHRWPLAVLPLDLAGRTGVPLYAMPWEVRKRGRVMSRGELQVCSGAAWAIERSQEVFHAVRSLAPHLSLVLSDVTEPAAREIRLSVTPVSAATAREVLARASHVLQAGARGNQRNVGGYL